MNEPTRNALIQLSRAFYDDEASTFDATRQRPWPGWRRLLPHLQGESPLRTLDAGCGNGRFARFLDHELERPLLYLGLDSSRHLLAAGEDLMAPATRGSDSRFLFEEAEIQVWLDAYQGDGFDLVVLFGVLHHIPSRRHRRRLLEACGRCLSPRGCLVATWWMLHRSHRFEKKKAPWSESPQIDRSQLEGGDHLLRWQGRSQSPRYCHFPGEEELADLENLPEMDPVEEFSEDGPGGEDNLYRVYRKRCTPGA